jgi:LCP family protein required for cell wall assembly
VRHHRIAKIISLTMASVLLTAGSAVALRVSQLNSNINSVDIGSLQNQVSPHSGQAGQSQGADPTDSFSGRAVNILVMATDSRQGDNEQYSPDGEEGLLNDVNMILHVSADRRRIDIVAIPRDTLLAVPQCELPDGSMAPAQQSAALNTAYSKGLGGDPTALRTGIACVVNTIQEATGVPIDGFFLVEFASFVGMVDALDGVDMCIPEPMDSIQSGGLHLEAGMQHLDGPTALKFARARKGQSAQFRKDGSDLKRIGRQQELIAALAKKVLASNKLSSLWDLNTFASAATKSLTASPNLDTVQDLVGLAFSLRHLRMENVSLMLAPVTSAGDQQHVRLVETGDPSAQDLFDALHLDQPLPGTVAYKVAQQGSGDLEVPPASSDSPTGTPGAPPVDPLAPDPGVTTPLTVDNACG